jgi:hypothetical protein
VQDMARLPPSTNEIEEAVEWLNHHIRVVLNATRMPSHLIKSRVGMCVMFLMRGDVM